MAAPFIAVLANDAVQVQVSNGDDKSQLFFRLATRAGVRGFSFGRVQFAAAGTPQAEVRLLRAFHKQDLVRVIKAVE